MARVTDRGHLRIAGEGFAAAYEGVGDGEYDPKGFYCESFNKHNHRSDSRVPMKPELLSRIQELVASGALAGTPIKSYAAFMRDAAHHNMERIGKLLDSPEILEIAAQFRHEALIERDAEEVERLQRIVADADQRFNTATKVGDTWWVERLIGMYETSHATMREPYATQLEEVLKDARRWLRAKQPSE